MKHLPAIVTLALGSRSALAAVPVWGQCGGINYTGDKTCASGSYCQVQNDWYHQCVPGTATTTVVSTTTQSPSSSTTAVPPTTTAGPPPATTGFVQVSGTRFTLNGSKYTVVGGNSYWVGLTGLGTADMSKAFADVAAAGGTTIRTWGFNEVTSQNGNWYQSWSGSNPTTNAGSTGLQNFDQVVAAAKANGIRLIVALTNNWADYGGMDVYVQQILNSANHDLFYTDDRVKTAFKNYVRTFVGRYVNEPGILAWELANEPRCRGSTGTTSGACTPATITAWIKEMSAYIKSLDGNHLVAIGDEGFYNQPGAPTYPYQGGEGIDFDVNLAIPTVDFGTFHAYPDHWGQKDSALAWGVQWIRDHAASQTAANKPVILEEFGMLDGKDTIYSAWFDAVVSSGLAGDLIWQSGSTLSTGNTHNDGFTVYPGTSTYTLLTQHAAALKARA